jgi:hypothetical protein
MARHLLDLHVLVIQSCNQITPVRACPFKAVRPELKEEFKRAVVSQDTPGPAQGVKFIALDIHFDQVNALTRLKKVVKRYDIDRHRSTRISFYWIRPVINV